MRASNIAQAVQELPEEFRLIYVDHRGVGRSDKPHEVEAHAMPLRVADAVAVLDELGIERAHFVGTSYGARLGFGIGETFSPTRAVARDRRAAPVRHQPRHPARVIAETLTESRREGTLEPFVEALESFSCVRFPDAQRALYLDNDPAAIEAASSAMVAEGAISEDLRAWEVRCLIYVGARDVDSHGQAQRAASEIPNAEFISLEERDHVGANLAQVDPVLPAVLRTLRGNT